MLIIGANWRGVYTLAIFCIVADLRALLIFVKQRFNFLKNGKSLFHEKRALI